MHFKQDTNFAKVAQFIKANSNVRTSNEILAGDMFEELSTIIDYPYEECEGKTLATITKKEDILEYFDYFDEVHGIGSVPSDIIEAFLALEVERGQCSCGGDLRFLEIPFGMKRDETPYRHICCHCHKTTDCSEIYNAED